MGPSNAEDEKVNKGKEGKETINACDTELVGWFRSLKSVFDKGLLN